MRVCTSTPSLAVLAPARASAAISSGCTVMPAPRPASSTGGPPNPPTPQPSRRSKAAQNNPDIDPPITTARLARCFLNSTISTILTDLCQFGRLVGRQADQYRTIGFRQQHHRDRGNGVTTQCEQADGFAQRNP